MSDSQNPVKPIATRRWGFAAVAGLLGFAVAFLLAEVGLALTGRGYNYDEPAMHFDVADPQTGFWYKPRFQGRWRSDHHEFDTRPTQNSAGIRGSREYPPRPEPGVFRIALIGDSMVRGLEVEDQEVFSALLEERLNRECSRLASSRFWPSPEAPRAVEVLNFGRSGAGAAIEASILKFKALPFVPHLIVLFPFPNDIPEDNTLLNLGHVEQIDSDGIVSRWRGIQVARPISWFERAARRSHVVNYVFRQWRYFRHHQALKKAGGASLYFGGLFHETESDEVKRLWTATERFLTAGAALCRHEQIAFALAALPFPPQIAASHANYRGLNHEFRNGQIMQSAAYQNHLARFCAAGEILCFDLLLGYQAAKAAAPQTRLFFDIDQHLTPAGHRVAAALLAEWICAPAADAAAAKALAPIDRKAGTGSSFLLPASAIATKSHLK